jgi:hypothetical protein
MMSLKFVAEIAVVITNLMSQIRMNARSKSDER